VFCGETGVTKGHVWPDWLNNVLPYTATHHEQATGIFSTFTPDVPGPPKSFRQRQGHARSRKPRNTCGKCNGGWMSRIESDVIPIATPLILGRQCRVTEEGQRKPAAFLCLVSMRTEYLGELRAIPPEDRRYLMEHFEPPALWFVWIARYAGNKPDEHWSRYCGMQLCSEGTGPVSEVGPEHCNTQVTTMVLGKLCTHVFSSTETPVLGYEGIRMTRIWPQSGFVIDTRFLPTWDDAAVLWLHEALARESTPLPSPQTRGVNTDERRDPQIKG
jgi:hypothetical protein